MEAKKFFLKIIYFFVGNRCILCNIQSFVNKIICDSCKELNIYHINDNKNKVCIKCSCYILHNQDSNLCQSCIVDVSHFFKNINKTRSFLLYNNFLSNIMQSYKYSDTTYISKFLASLIRQDFLEFFHENKIDYILPVPISQEKLRIRMFNQINLILLNFSNLIDGKKILYDCVIKTQDTESQVSLNYEERIRKKHYFKLKNEDQVKIFGKNILIFDDVITTGSTVGAIAAILKKFNVNIYAYSVGRTIISK